MGTGTLLVFLPAGRMEKPLAEGARGNWGCYFLSIFHVGNPTQCLTVCSVLQAPLLRVGGAVGKVGGLRREGMVDVYIFILTQFTSVRLREAFFFFF